MRRRHRHTVRERVFIESLLYHGFRRTYKRKNLKFRRGYIIPATDREDAGGIDFFVKMPRDERFFPVQVTQRGNRLFREFCRLDEVEDEAAFDKRYREFVCKSDERVRTKQVMCYRHGIAFVLVRDFGGDTTNPNIAWGDIKALRHAIVHLKRRLE